MNRPPILVTATYSGVLQMWNTTETKWKTQSLKYPTEDYMINTLTVDRTRKMLAVGGTNVVKLYNIELGDFKERGSGIGNQSNVTALGRI
jgi:hypothetical protein